MLGCRVYTQYGARQARRRRYRRRSAHRRSNGFEARVCVHTSLLTLRDATTQLDETQTGDRSLESGPTEDAAPREPAPEAADCREPRARVRNRRCEGPWVL